MFYNVELASEGAYEADVLWNGICLCDAVAHSKTHTKEIILAW